MSPIDEVTSFSKTAFHVTPSFSVFQKYAKLWELTGARDLPPEDDPGS